jgi:hypothetical protein
VVRFGTRPAIHAGPFEALTPAAPALVSSAYGLSQAAAWCAAPTES